MEYNGIAAKGRKKLKSYCFYAPFASLRGYSLFPLRPVSVLTFDTFQERTEGKAERRR
jgi:hypothetical protein